MFKKLQKIIEYGLYSIAFLLPIQTRLFLRAGDLNGYSEYATISLYGIDILIGIILCLNFYVVFKKLSTFNFQLSTFWWFIAGLDLFIFISIFFAQDLVLAIYRYGLFLLGVGLFWLVNSVNYNRIKLIWSFVLGLSFQAIFGIYQFLTQSSFVSKWLGIAQHNVSDLGASVIETLNGERWLRAYGGFDHPNILGGAVIIGLLVLISFFIKDTRYKIQETNKFQIPCPPLQAGRCRRANSKFLITIYSLLFTVLLFSFSRAAWLAFTFGIIILFGFYFFQRNYLKQKIVLKIILISSVLLFTFYNIYPNIFQTRIQGETRLEVKSNQERIISLQESKEVIKDNLFFGTGIGNYTLFLAEKYPNQESYNYQPVHNTFLLVLSEIGIFGFLFFVSCILYLVFYNFKKKKYLNIAVLFSIIIMMLFDHWWWSLHFGVLLLFFILGLMYNKEKN